MAIQLKQSIKDLSFRRKFKRIWSNSNRYLVLDFDGVLTDDAVFTTDDAREFVRSSRSDGMGIEALRNAGFHITVISKEQNPVVTARCKKLGIEVFQGINEKDKVLKTWAVNKHVDLSDVCYIGNDVNDIPCLRMVGIPMVVLDAHPLARKTAHLVIPRKGGNGAIRFISDLIISNI